MSKDYDQQINTIYKDFIIPQTQAIKTLLLALLNSKGVLQEKQLMDAYKQAFPNTCIKEYIFADRVVYDLVANGDSYVDEEHEVLHSITIPEKKEKK